MPRVYYNTSIAVALGGPIGSLAYGRVDSMTNSSMGKFVADEPLPVSQHYQSCRADLGTKLSSPGRP